MKSKLQTTSFWLGLTGAIVLILDTISGLIGINLYSDVVKTIIISVCSILVTVGIITKRNVTDKEKVSQEELLEDLDESVKK